MCHCDVSIKPSLSPSAVQLRKREGVSFYMWNFLVFFSTWYETKSKISKKLKGDAKVQFSGQPRQLLRNLKSNFDEIFHDG